MFVLPTVVIGAAVLAVLPASIERGVVAIVAAHVLFNLAVVVRTVGAVLATLPRDREAAAATLGAAPSRVFREITLPAILPAIGAAAAIVFVFTFTSFGVVRILGDVRNSTIEVEIWRQATRFGDIGSAATLTVVQLAAHRRPRASCVGEVAAAAQPAARADRRPPAPAAQRGGQRRLVAVTAIGHAAVIAVPMAALVERSLRTGNGYSLRAWRNLGTAEVRPGIRIGIDPVAALPTSLRVMVVAVVLAVVVGSLAALAIAAAQAGGRLLDTAMMLPIATSAVTIGFGILITFDEDPFDWRGTLVDRPDRPCPRGDPVRRAHRSARAPRRRGAATGSGGDARRVTAAGLACGRAAPPAAGPLVVAAGLAAAISLGEFGATSFLSRSGQETMPIAIERLLGRTGTLLQGQGYALAVILAAATIAVVRRPRRAARPGDRRPMSELVVTRRPRRLRRSNGARRGRPDASRPGRSSACSDRRAAASRRCCG